MDLSDRDLRKAIETGRLIVDPPPDHIDSTSIDLHLDAISALKIWNMEKFRADTRALGYPGHELKLGTFDYRKVADGYLVSPPAYTSKSADQKVLIRERQRGPGQTRRLPAVADPGDRRDAGGWSASHLFCRRQEHARTDRAPRSSDRPDYPSVLEREDHAEKEISNVGPFDFVLEEGDSIAEITVAQISSTPQMTMKARGSVTYRQAAVSGQAGEQPRWKPDQVKRKGRGRRR